MLSKIKSIIKCILLTRQIDQLFFSQSPEQYLKRKYKKFFGRDLDFVHPATLSEKIQVLRMYQYPFDERVIQAADKFTLHEFLQQKQLTELMVPYLAVYEKVEDFSFDQLPQSFVLKKTNASGLLLIVKNKDKMSEKQIRKILKKWFTTDFGRNAHEPHYSQAKNRVICEPYFPEIGNEYRLFMVSGELGFTQVTVWDWADTLTKKFDVENAIEGQSTHYRIHLDSDWQLYYQDDSLPKVSISKPEKWDKMLAVSKKIAADFPLVRVDFNKINGEIKITELTFTPSQGYLELLRERPDLDYQLGEKI